jgi:hypothetical protein
MDSSLDSAARAHLDAALEPDETVQAWAWGPSDLPSDPGAILGQVIVTLLGAFWRALLSPLLRLLALLGRQPEQQVLTQQCWMAVTDRRLLAQPFLFQRRILASGPSEEVRLEPTGPMQAWALDTAPQVNETVVRSARLLGIDGQAGLVIAYLPGAGDTKAERALALRSLLFEG